MERDRKRTKPAGLIAEPPALRFQTCLETNTDQKRLEAGAKLPGSLQRDSEHSYALLGTSALRLFCSQPAPKWIRERVKFRPP